MRTRLVISDSVSPREIVSVASEMIRSIFGFCSFDCVPSENVHCQLLGSPTEVSVKRTARVWQVVGPTTSVSSSYENPADSSAVVSATAGKLGPGTASACPDSDEVHPKRAAHRTKHAEVRNTQTIVADVTQGELSVQQVTKNVWRRGFPLRGTG